MSKKLPTRLAKHGHVRVDDYYWLRERDNPEVNAYLNVENEYAAKEMAHAKAFEERLFEEIKPRIKQTDMSVPYRRDGYFYYTRYEEGKEYPIYARKRGSLDSSEDIMLDANVLAQGHDYFSIGGWAVSSGQNILAYAVDTQGRRIYSIHFKNLITGELLADVIPEVTENLTWANDNQTLFYAKQDPMTLRANRIFRHGLGVDPAADRLVFEEKDGTFGAYVFKTKSKTFLMIVSSQTLSQEYRYLDADNLSGEFKIFLPREKDHEYQLDHFQDRFLIRTNEQAKNFKLMTTPVDQTGKEHWREIVPPREDVYLGDFDVFKDHLVLEERKRGLTEIRVVAWDGSNDHYLEFDEPAYRANLGMNPELDTATLRFEYTSLKTPLSISDVDMATRPRPMLTPG